MPRKLRVLIIAEEANPEWVSVPLVGWSIANSLKDICDTHIVTQVRNQTAFERAGLISEKNFTALDTEALAKPLWKISNFLRGDAGKGWTTVRAVKTIGYYYFEHLLWKKFGSSIIRGEYDIVHRVTPLSPTVPSLLAKKCRKAGVPFVLGPLNGGVPWPKEFSKARQNENEWLSYIRNIYKRIPGYHSTIESSSAIICGSKYTLSEIPKNHQNKCIYIPENAVDPAKFSPPSKINYDKPLKACFIGRLVPYKGPDMLIEAAIPLVQQGRITVDILGDGPLLNEIKDTLRSNNISEGIVLHGWVEHTEVQEIISKCHMLTFPSIREFGGGVVLEAMATGLVPLIVDYAGPAELVTTETGFKVPLGQRAEIISSFSSTLKEISENPEMLIDMRLNGVKQVGELYTWMVKADQILEVYEWVLNPKLPKPNPLNTI